MGKYALTSTLSFNPGEDLGNEIIEIKGRKYRPMPEPVEKVKTGGDLPPDPPLDCDNSWLGEIF
jgi:hypothetical protein